MRRLWVRSAVAWQFCGEEVFQLDWNSTMSGMQSTVVARKQVVWIHIQYHCQCRLVVSSINCLFSQYQQLCR
jgi:hypothetical protein